MKKMFKLCNTGRSQNGFTLIEMIVVVAIIGVLATAVIMSLIGAQAKARDSQRASDIKQVQTAVEMFHEVEGTSVKQYPGVNHELYVSFVSRDDQDNIVKAAWAGLSYADKQFENDLKKYLDPLPMEPRCRFLCKSSELNYYYSYVYVNEIKQYAINSGIEVRTDLADNDGGVLQSKDVYFKGIKLFFPGRYEIGNNQALLGCFDTMTYRGGSDPYQPPYPDLNTDQQAVCDLYKLDPDTAID